METYTVEQITERIKSLISNVQSNDTKYKQHYDEIMREL
jgi:hypothetical protein